jgi:exopolyphosphatase/guanosine-5'-triphosphate,3'-diphosphate pyrophosphatase
MKTIAALDIGSNAIRFAIAKPEKNKFEVLKSFRAPLRLGSESFGQGEFSESTIGYAVEIFKSFQELAKLFKVEKVIACATSAMREATNSIEFIDRIKQSSGIHIETITGEKEASLILEGIKQTRDITKGEFLLLDIGGGSVELSFLKDGKRIDSESFKIGTVRIIASAKDGSEQDRLINEASQGIEKFLQKNNLVHKRIHLIGTGGNFKRLRKIQKVLTGQESKVISESEFRGIYSKVSHYSNERIIGHFDLKPDQADVLKPALQIILNVTRHIQAESIYLSRSGLIDGILFSMVKGKI